MQLSRDTKKFLVTLCVMTVGLTLVVRHFETFITWGHALIGTMMPFIVGACLAFLLSVPMHLYDKLLSHPIRHRRECMPFRIRRPLSLVLAIITVFALLILFAVIVLPKLISAISSLAVSLMQLVPVVQSALSDVTAQLKAYPDIYESVSHYIPDLNKLALSAISFMQRYAGLIASNAVSYTSGFFGSLTDVLISFVFAASILMQKETLSKQFRKLIYAFMPKTFGDRLLEVSGLTHKTFFSYVTIQCTEACILGSLCLIGMLILHFPYALVISVIMLFCALIPIYGAILSCIIGAFLVLSVNPGQTIWFVVFILVLQQIENNFIYPRVVSTSINLPSMWVLLAVTAGGGLFGIAGMLTAVPITSVVYTLLGKAMHARLRSRGLDESETNDSAQSSSAALQNNSESL